MPPPEKDDDKINGAILDHKSYVLIELTILIMLLK
jgi:hypothetical protein